MINLSKSAPDPQSYAQLAQESSQRVALIEQLLSIGTALSSAHNLVELLTLILSKSREITCSDAGSVYLVDRTESLPRLIFKVSQNFSLPQLSFHEFAIPLTESSLSGYVALTGEILNIQDAYQLPSDVPYGLDKKFDQEFSYRTRSVLVLPMQNQEGEIIGVVQLLNRKFDPTQRLTPENTLDQTQEYSTWEEQILRSLASQAAISIERNHLQESIENLFEGFVRASVQAIESRDPTTSGHSERVADLTVRLTEEVNAVDQGSLALWSFTEKQLQEVRYAALLHDFGKIGVPEAILNKQKKLYPEAYGVIRERFSVAKRTAQWQCAQDKFRHLVEHPQHRHQHPDSHCPHCQQLARFDRQLTETIAQLDEYWAMVQEFNEPEAVVNRRFEALSEETFYKVTQLAKYRYRDVDGQEKALVNEQDLEQLLLPRGNLNPQERRAIESHVTHSFYFLQKIPWTTALQDVPAIAYGHHEKLDGSGYPQGLKANAIPYQSQIMAIADIYDALTARDRPYKRPLPVPIVLKILREEAEKHKLNHDLVQLFEQRQVFQVLGHDANHGVNGG